VLTTFHDEKAFIAFEKGQFSATACITPAKKLFPDFGKNHGMLSEVIHPTASSIGTSIHCESDGRIILLIGAGIPSTEYLMARTAFVKGLVVSIGLYVAQLSAVAELLALDSIEKPQYWLKENGGFRWKPSARVQVRAARRMLDIEGLMRRARQ